MFRKYLIGSMVIATLILPLGVAVASPAASPTPVLSLDKCLELAYANSQQLKGAAKSVTIAKEAVREAEGGFLPTVGYAVAVSKTEKPLNPNPGTESSGASVSVSQPLYTGGKLSSGLSLAKLKLEATLEDERKAKQTLTYNVKQAYYQVWLADQVLKVAQSSFENMAEHARNVQRFYQVGTSSKYDLLRAEVERDTFKPQIVKAQNGLELAKLNLAILIGLPKNEAFTVASTQDNMQIPKTFTFAVEQVLEEAYRERPEMHQIKQAEDIANYQTKLAAAGYKPNLALVGKYQGGSYDYSPENWSSYWSLALNLSGNFFDGYTTQAKVAQTKGNEELIAIREANLRDQLRLEVEQALQTVKEGIETTNANLANIDLAKESLRLTKARFEAGMATTTDVKDAQLTLDEALTGYYQGIAAYMTALAKVDLAVGKNI